MPTTRQGDPAEAAAEHHHASHRGLLKRPLRAPHGPSTIDALVVPTSRSTAYLDTVIRLAAWLGCPLVVLCSKLANARQAVQRADKYGTDIIAIDIADVPPSTMPFLATTELLADTEFERRTDTSFKRNLGMLLAHLAGWKRIIFLDDDISVPNKDDVISAAALLDSCAAVGLSIGGYPDNSVVCHAYRAAGGPQDSFIGGGALAVQTSSLPSFFPKIYNEDWFFLLDDVRLRPLATTGTVVQSPYDPFANDARARSEELGDTLAEGIFWLLDHGRRVQDADAEYWKGFLNNRRRFIGEVIEMLGSKDVPSAERTRMINSLKAACGRSMRITPRLCVDYLRAWRADTRRWRRHVTEQSEKTSGMAMTDPGKILSELGVMSYTNYYQRTRSAS